MLLLGPRMSPLLRGGDPAPGDGEQIMSVVRRLREIGRTAGDTADLIGRLGTGGAEWSGPAAEAFSRRRHKLLELLRTAIVSGTP